MQYGKSFPSTMERIFSELATYGFTCLTVKGDGTICGHSLTSVWIDEAPNVGSGIAGILLPNDTVSYFSYAAPRLSFLAKSMRIHFTTKQDDIYVQNA